MKALVLISCLTLCLINWCYAEKLPDYESLSSLVDPAKAPKSAKGNAYKKFNQLLGYMHTYKVEKGVKPREFLDKIYKYHSHIKPYYRADHVFAPSLEKKFILEAYKEADEVYGAFNTQENLTNLKKRKAAIVTKGNFIGEILDVDHTIPKSKAKEFYHAMGNFTLMPQSLNRVDKKDKITQHSLRKLKEYSHHIRRSSDVLSVGKSYHRRSSIWYKHDSFKMGLNKNKQITRIKDSGRTQISKTIRKGIKGGVALDLAVDTYISIKDHQRMGRGEITSNEFAMLSSIRIAKVGIAVIALTDPEPISKAVLIVSYGVTLGVEYAVENTAAKNYKDRMRILDEFKIETKYEIVRDTLEAN